MPPKAKKTVLLLKKKAPPRAKPKTTVVVKGRGDYIPTRFNRVKGRGGYFSDLGGAVGGGVGGIVDSGVSIFKAITGRGRYRGARNPNANAATYRDRARAANEAYRARGGVVNLDSMNMGAMNVQFATAKGNPRVTHREFIGAVTGSTAFSTKSYRIQPGLRGADVLFPWGSTVANCFTQYQLNGMILEYKSRSTNYSAAVQLGAVMMSTEYDSEEPPLSNQLAVDNHTFTTSDTPDRSFIHPIECAASESSVDVRYINSTNGPQLNDDTRFNDVGIFQVSTVGMPAAADGAVVGELWAVYDITFLKPKLPDIHAGTSALFSALRLADGELFQTASGLAQWDQASSLPVKLFPGAENTRLALPVGYAGSFQVTITSLVPAAYSFTQYPRLSSWGNDVTVLKAFAGVDSSNFEVNNQTWGLNAYGLTDDFATAQTDKGNVAVYTFSTIAESAAENYLEFIAPSAGQVMCVTVLINAMDSDIGAGDFGPSPPATLGLSNKRALRKQLYASAQHASEFQRELAESRELTKSLARRLAALEAQDGVESMPDTPRPNTDLSNSMVASALRQALGGLSLRANGAAGPSAAAAA